MNLKLTAFAFLAVLAGCSSTTTQPSSPANDTSASSPPTSTPAGAGGECNAAPVQSLVGQAFGDRAAQNAGEQAGASTVRVLQPGQVMTMEYNPERLTIVVDEARNIASLRCG